MINRLLVWWDVRRGRVRIFLRDDRDRAVIRWNWDKPHRCPACHAIYTVDRPSGWAIYRCCRCGATFARLWRLWRVLPYRGVVCPENHEEDE